MSRIAVIGTGYVGLTSAVCFAHLGHEVIGVDVNEDKVARLRRGETPILEEGLEALLRQGLASGRLSFVADASEAVPSSDVVFLCVPTPQGADGAADLSFLDAASSEIAPLLRPGAVVVNKSTVPVGTADRVRRALRRLDVSVVSNPEFLREGTAVGDFLRPSRVVVGSDSVPAAEIVAGLYSGVEAPVIITDAASAEMIKYACNAFLAAKLSFVNGIAALCERLGADITEVVQGVGSDPRIGAQFLSPGPGWGGSCFPKDTVALLNIAAGVNFEFPLLEQVVESNVQHLDRMADKVEAAAGGSLSGTQVAVWGLTFKAGTDDLRCSPSLAVIDRLKERGATIVAYDPAVRGPVEGIEVMADPYSACRDADVLVILTEWAEFTELDMPKVHSLLARPSVVDGRNLFQPGEMAGLGFTYDSIGRATMRPKTSAGGDGADSVIDLQRSSASPAGVTQVVDGVRLAS